MNLAVLLITLLNMSNNKNNNKNYGSTNEKNKDYAALPKIIERSKSEPPLDVAALVAPMYETHKSTVNTTYQWRMKNLRKLRTLHTKHRSEWEEALLHDMGKQRVEAFVSEVKLNIVEIDYFLANLKKLMKPTPASSAGYNIPCFAQIDHRPLGPPAVLVIGASNYPLQLVFAVTAGAIAGGNPVVIKPSEQAPATSNLIAKLCAQYFDHGSIQVVEGGAEVVTPLLQHSKWAKIAFTGSERVGRIVAAAAAKTLSPVLLELGGKSPCYVDYDAAPTSLHLAAQRIVWGKTWNAGQTCVCPDYLIVHENHKDRLVKELVGAVQQQFGPNVETSELGRMIQESHAARQVELIKEVEKAGGNCKIVMGGSALCNVKDKFIHPTIVVDPPRDSRLLTEEIFGPILPIVTVKSRKEAQEFIQSMYGTPLAMYIFTNSDSVFREMVRTCPAASTLRNDVLVHFGHPALPMGGLGTSGYGNYHGIFSWRAFTHAQSQVFRPCIPTADFGGTRYHPFKGLKEKVVLFMVELPMMPPLHLRYWFLAGAAVYATLNIETLRFGLADVLAIGVDWLRKGYIK